MSTNPSGAPSRTSSNIAAATRAALFKSTGAANRTVSVSRLLPGFLNSGMALAASRAANTSLTSEASSTSASPSRWALRRRGPVDIETKANFREAEAFITSPRRDSKNAARLG
jgi:hypothetical protein